jgi:hypothetical protein
MRKENIKRQSADFRKSAEDSLNYEVKLKKFSLLTYKTTHPAHRGIMPQALGAVHILLSRETAKYRTPKKPGKRMTANPSRACRRAS